MPDWSAQTAADLKIAIKAYILSAVLNSKSDEQIREHVRQEVEEFRQEFGEAQAEDASGYVQELTALGSQTVVLVKVQSAAAAPLDNASTMAIDPAL